MTPAGESVRLKLCLRLLTPVFIGSGEKLSRFEYVIEQSGSEQRILIADVNRMLEVAAHSPGGGLMERLESAALRGERLEDVLQPQLRLGGGTAAGWLRQKRAVAEELQLDPAASQQLPSGPTPAQTPQGRGPQRGAQRRTQTEYQIQRHLRTPDGGYYIPGSELKGSLRVAVLYRLLCEGTAAEADQARSNLKGGLEAIESQENTEEEDEEELTLERLATRLDRQLLRLPGRDGDAKYDLFRFIHFSDTTVVEADRVAVLHAKVQPIGSTREQQQGQQQSGGQGRERTDEIPLFIEALLPDVELECTLTVAPPDSEPVQRWCGGNLPAHMREVLSVDWLLAAWRLKSRDLLQEEIRREGQQRDPILRTLQQSCQQGKVLLRVGGGQGLLSTTVDLYIKNKLRELYQNVVAAQLGRGRRRGGEFPSSRRVAHYDNRLWPLGWIEVVR
jgi:CRISPR/Cas system CSM-associated protein Csm5 (group 7 of RAMP superfamily)